MTDPTAHPFCQPQRRPAGCRALAWAVGLAAFAAVADAAPPEQSPQALEIQARAANQVLPLLRTLKALVAIESGSRDLEGLAAMADQVQGRLQAAGMRVERSAAVAPADHALRGARLGDMVYATRHGSGAKSVLLIAHMDTVYRRGMAARQPFRIDGDRAYGLGISDAKGGVALVLHTVELLNSLSADGYSRLGVLFNPDEEIGSPGSAALLTRLGSEYDAVMSFEGGGFARDALRLATSAIATAELKVTGRASHAGGNPEAGRNALYEMAHQVLSTRDFGEPAIGLKLNWTIAQAGDTRNVIPAHASATGDVRAVTNADLDRLESRLRDATLNHLIPDTHVELTFTRGRPALQASDAARALAHHAQNVYAELGLMLDVSDRPSGGGTDAAYAGLKARGAVVESFGLRGYGAHSSDDEFVLIPSIAPRLYLASRMVLDVGSGRVGW